jgi:hypothetical protein
MARREASERLRHVVADLAELFDRGDGMRRREPIRPCWMRGLSMMPAVDASVEPETRESHGALAGRQRRMSPDADEKSVQSTQTEMTGEADRMESRLDDLGDKIDEAAKKAKVTRDEARPDPGDPVDEPRDVMP